MGPLILTAGAFVPWTRVREVKWEDDQHFLVVDDGSAYPVGNFDQESVIIQIIPAAAGWEAIIPWPNENDVHSPQGFPVIAFALTAKGTTKPITAFDNMGVEGDYALRAPGEQRVTSTDGVFASADAWFKKTWKPQFTD
ncbi:hypothetical protein VPG91_06200 [Nitrospirillum amazonense]|uniref:hypothetical protein n=1 Tax=Nitrospirillum amazonense TaxID=28077 RepID=UPI002DD42E1A|nr:hypothetical protein [Nitrospirillum amazonense]MEC4590571.1 hypothetical protein [Nitrospirillum amazonense]